MKFAIACQIRHLLRVGGMRAPQKNPNCVSGETRRPNSFANVLRIF